MTSNRLGVGVLGAHAWANKAHLPGFKSCERMDLVAICDVVKDRADALAQKFGIRKVYAHAQQLIDDPEIQMVDVCTPTDTHLELSLAVIAAGKHVLCEKPIARSAADAYRLHEATQAKGLRSKTGFTFRYSPALRQIRAWIEDGTIGEIFHIHGFEQNSQFLDPNFPLRQVPAGANFAKMSPQSIEGYGSHLVDLMRWMGGEFSAVSASMRSYVPERMVRGYEGLQKIVADDGTVGIVEFASGAQGVLQTSIVAVGNYPGVEIRVYGSKGAAIGRLVSERGIAETLHFARPDAVEFEPVTLPDSHYPPGASLKTLWAELYYRNLARHWADEILDGGRPEATFLDGARSQEIVDACVASHFERRWISLPKYA